MSDDRTVGLEGLAALGSLSEPTRRALYEHVCSAGEAVGRDAAAAAVGVSRGVAAFHLDRLADDGLLDVEYRRLSGRTGPGAGRPAKLYRRAAVQVNVSLPPRQHGLAAAVLAEAVDRVKSPSARRAVAEAAREQGRRLAAAPATELRSRASRRSRVDALLAVLTSGGFEPYEDDGEIRMRNCPFHPLASAHVDLVCGMNHELVAGAAEELGLDVPLRLDPRPGECCVVITA